MFCVSNNQKCASPFLLSVYNYTSLISCLIHTDQKARFSYLFMYVYMYVLCVCVDVCIYIYMCNLSVCMYVYICMRVYVCLHVCK